MNSSISKIILSLIASTLIGGCINPNITTYPLIGNDGKTVELPKLSKVRLYEDGNLVEYIAFKYSIKVDAGELTFINARTHDTKKFRGLFLVD